MMRISHSKVQIQGIKQATDPLSQYYVKSNYLFAWQVRCCASIFQPLGYILTLFSLLRRSLTTEGRCAKGEESVILSARSTS